MNCLLCNSPTRFRFTHDHFNLYWCEYCDFGRLAGDFTPEQVGVFYPENYYTHKKTSDQQGKKLSLLDRAMLHLAWRCDSGANINPSETTGKSVCDIGCGNGSNLRKFQQAGYRTIGVEPDPRARTVASDAGHIFSGTAEDLPIDTKFDVVLMSHVLEHCIDPVLALRNAASILNTNPNGSLIIEVPNNAARSFNWFEGKWPWTDIPRHLSFFTEKSLGRITSKIGLQIDKVIYVGYTRQFMPNWRTERSEE
ncbi:MAG: class I SAM-dependent methyltransferase, partial [Rhodanobacter sp.]|nr:class I SAM-dependent methyltransferase [Rhodanobacter sp.]